jgi:hypothetical protein
MLGKEIMEQLFFRRLWVRRDELGVTGLGLRVTGYGFGVTGLGFGVIGILFGIVTINGFQKKRVTIVKLDL